MATAKKDTAKTKATSPSGNQKVMAIITERICKQLEEGHIPWDKPWAGIRGGAYSRSTGRPYSLINQMLLLKPGEYVTFKQCTEAGGTIREGETSSIVIFWKRCEKKEQGADGTEKKAAYFVLRYYRVFHIDQCDGIDPKYTPESFAPLDPVAEAEDIISDYAERTCLTIVHKRQNSAAYSASLDRVIMPLREQFKNAPYYYATIFHELGHSTGHETRINREIKSAFSTEKYSREELVAELTSAGMMHSLGLDTKAVRKNEAAYIQSWLEALQNDAYMITWAASQASKAIDLIMNTQVSDEPSLGLETSTSISDDQAPSAMTSAPVSAPPSKAPKSTSPAKSKRVKPRSTASEDTTAYAKTVQKAAASYASECHKRFSDVRPNLAGAFMLEGKQCITDGHVCVRYESPMADIMAVAMSHDHPNLTPVFEAAMSGIVETVPPLQTLKKAYAEHKKVKGKELCITKIGTSHFNTAFLIKAIGLIGKVDQCTLSDWKMYVKGEGCDAIIMALRVPDKADNKNTAA